MIESFQVIPSIQKRMVVDQQCLCPQFSESQFRSLPTFWKQHVVSISRQCASKCRNHTISCSSVLSLGVGSLALTVWLKAMTTGDEWLWQQVMSWESIRGVGMCLSVMWGFLCALSIPPIELRGRRDGKKGRREEGGLVKRSGRGDIVRQAYLQASHWFDLGWLDQPMPWKSSSGWLLELAG